jgi:pyruvate/2-oxoglutarate dehydrogenase complex dihydrolipoamide acyltransferase (E2) component
VTQVPITVPDLDLANQTLMVSCWLVRRGREVVVGDRVIELAAGDVIVDLPAPASGRLIQRDVAEGQVVQSGQILGRIDSTQDDA